MESKFAVSDTAQDLINTSSPVGFEVEPVVP